MKANASGKLIAKLETTSGTSAKGNDWLKKTFIIGVQNGNYEDMVAMEAWGDQVSTIESIDLGVEVTVDVNIKSREYNGRWYTEIKAWKIEVKSNIKAPQGYSTQAPQVTTQHVSSQDNSSGLPF